MKKKKKKVKTFTLWMMIQSPRRIVGFMEDEGTYEKFENVIDTNKNNRNSLSPGH
jgi:hypothetical protein